MANNTIESIGIIGYGFAGQLHEEALSERFTADKILVLDTSTDKLDMASGKGHKVFDNLEDLLSVNPTLVISATPPVANESTIQLIVNADVRGILIEKPIALTSKTAALIDSNLSQAGIFAMAGLTGHGFHPEFKEAKKVIEEGLLGNIHTFIEQIHQGGPAFPQHYVTEEYGGAIKELGIHTIDHMHYLLSEDNWGVASVSGGNDYWEGSSPDWCEVSLTSDKITAHASWAFVKDFPAPLNRDNYSTVIMGSKGKMIIYGFDGLEFKSTQKTGEFISHRNDVNIRDRHYPGFRAEVNAFIDSYINNSASPVPLSYAANLQKYIDEIYQRVQI